MNGIVQVQVVVVVVGVVVVVVGGGGGGGGGVVVVRGVGVVAVVELLAVRVIVATVNSYWLSPKKPTTQQLPVSHKHPYFSTNPS